MKEHHKAWLAAHPERTTEWLLSRLSGGFHVHHIDGVRENNSPENLVLIDGVDHMRIHLAPSFTNKVRGIPFGEIREKRRATRTWRKIYKRPIGPANETAAVKRAPLSVKRYSNPIGPVLEKRVLIGTVAFRNDPEVFRPQYRYD